MAKYYQISVSQLVDTFSRIESGTAFDFSFNTSETVFSDLIIAKGDVLIASVNDSIYYKFDVVEKSTNELQLKKSFEVQKKINHSINEVGVFEEISESEYNSICSKLFTEYVSESEIDSEVETNEQTKIHVKEKYIGRFVFQILTYLNDLDSLDKIKPFFKINSDPSYTSIKSDDLGLTSIFKTSEKKLSKNELTFNDGKPRFFEDVLFNWENKYFYLSTEWTIGKDSRLDLDNFKALIEKYYPEFSIYENIGYYYFTDKIAAKGKGDQVKFDVSYFQDSCKNSGLIFSPQLIQRFVASLCTKRFVICSGLSGSGKTKLSQAFAQWISVNDSQYLIVPVGADWTNREPLLGYPNALNKEEYVSPENGVLDLIIRAKENIENKKEPTKPYFLILDEMNLSHVERYFADFLSTMESGDKIPLHKIQNDSMIVPTSINLPRNLFLVGTVNIDETTYMFSPKVLDRANTIEFRLNEKNLADFIASDTKLSMDLLKSQGANMSDSFIAMALKETDNNLKSSEVELKKFFSELKKSGAEFGYRTASEIGRLMYMLKELGESGDNLLDIAIMQKLLPKLHGSRNKLTKVLPILGGFCLTDNSKIKEDYLDKFVSNSLTEFELKTDTNIKYKISFEKICRMYKNAIENGFASYAEA
jgi:hypothetical protein